jgi:hypothetical protein
LVSTVKHSGETTLHQDVHSFFHSLEFIGVLRLESSRLLRALIFVLVITSSALQFKTMLEELEGLVRSEGLLVLCFSSQFCSLCFEKLCVIDVGVLLLELPDLIIKGFFLLSSSADLATCSKARVVVNHLASCGSELLELFQAWLNVKSIILKYFVTRSWSIVCSNFLRAYLDSLRSLSSLVSFASFLFLFI